MSTSPWLTPAVVSTFRSFRFDVFRYISHPINPCDVAGLITMYVMLCNMPFNFSMAYMLNLAQLSVLPMFINQDKL